MFSHDSGAVRAAFAAAAVLMTLAGADSLAQEVPLDTICYPYSVTPPPEPAFTVPKCRAEGETLYIDGMVDDALISELQYRPGIRRIELNSYGGRLEAGFELADYIRSHGIKTHVRKGAKCGSACTLLFMAGVERSAAASVRFLFHGVRNFAGGLEAAFQQLCETEGYRKCGEWLAEQTLSFQDSTEALFRRYIELGASPALWERYRSFEEDSDWFDDANFFRKKNWIMDAREARDLGIVQILTEE
jgi:hypothetical protein